jgi:hypothetical protein
MSHAQLDPVKIKSKHRKSTWILTVAAAYTVLPGCADDSPEHASPSSDAGVDAQVSIGLDAGIVARPPDASVNTVDAGSVVRPPDASIAVGLVLPPPTDAGSGVIGFMIIPRDDAGVDASVQSADAGPLLVGLVALVEGP